MTRLGAVGPALLCSATLAGCGGGNGSEDPSLSASELRERATALCEKSWSELTALGQPQSLEELRSFVDRSIPIVEEATAGFHDLRPPDELAEEWDEFLEIADENLDATRDLQEAVSENDGPRATRLLEDLGALNADSIRVAGALRIDGCVAPPP